MTQRTAEPSVENVSRFHRELGPRLGVELPASWAPNDVSYRQVYSSSQHVVETALFAMRDGAWNIGIGIGTVVDNEHQQLAGSAVKAADLAVSLGAKQGQLVPLRVEVAKPPRGIEQTQLGKHAQSVLQLLGNIVARRSEAEWAVIDRLDPGVRGQQRRVAGELGMTVQAVSQAIKRSLYNSEHEVRAAVSLLLEQADAAVTLHTNSAL